MPQIAHKERAWWSDTLLLGGLNAAIYLASYAYSGWTVPHLGTYVCWLGSIISLVPAARGVTTAHRRSALMGVALALAVLAHIVVTPCTGPCK